MNDCIGIAKRAIKKGEKIYREDLEPIVIKVEVHQEVQEERIVEVTVQHG